MAYDYDDNKSNIEAIAGAIGSGIGSIFSFKTEKEKQKSLKEQARLTEAQRLALIEQQKMLDAQAQVERAKAQGTEAEADSAYQQFLAKMKTVRSYAVPLAIAGSVAILALTYFYIKKSKKA
jgi:multidrug efflux pump subunit AcrA (membrane-fusion protein)